LARAAAGSLQEGQPTISDAVSHLLEEFPSGRSAVLLLCDPEPVAVAPALAALGVDLASRVTGQLLVIDATNRVSELANLLTVEPASSHESRPGLADVLAGNATWQQAVRRTRLPNLEMLSGGKEETAPDKPSLPMTNDGWAAVLRQLRQQYQFVLIGVSPGDSPAVTAIARAADAIYLVLRPGHTGHRAARNAVRTLHRCGGRVLGCLLVEHCTTGLDKQDG
jgi:Mrp family chromosome partitioning ATPase